MVRDRTGLHPYYTLHSKAMALASGQARDRVQSTISNMLEVLQERLSPGDQQSATIGDVFTSRDIQLTNHTRRVTLPTTYRSSGEQIMRLNAIIACEGEILNAAELEILGRLLFRAPDNGLDRSGRKLKANKELLSFRLLCEKVKRSVNTNPIPQM